MLEKFDYDKLTFKSDYQIKPFTTPPLNLIFHDVDNNELGCFYEEDKQLKFKGKVDKSAEVFVKEICRLFNKEIIYGRD